MQVLKKIHLKKSKLYLLYSHIHPMQVGSAIPIFPRHFFLTISLPTPQTSIIILFKLNIKF